MNNLTEEKVQQILLTGGYVKAGDFDAIREKAKIRGIGVVDMLVSDQLMTKDLVGQAIAENYKIKYADVNTNPPTKEQVLQIAEEIAKKYRIVITSETVHEITIATDNPDETLKLQSTLEENLKKKVRFAYVLTEDLDDLFRYYQSNLDTRLDAIIEAKEKIAENIIDEILLDAVAQRASDVHFEPYSDRVAIRQRVDGVLKEIAFIPKNVYENVLNRIKVLASMRLDEHFAAQDGAIRYKNKDLAVDLRISVIPIIEGEKIAIRILSQYIKKLALEELGLEAEDKKILEANAKKPFGMILNVGPTGSGKTTTLYALLQLVKDPGINITTIEDPVEYRIEGINQIQVNLQTNLTFAKGLKSIVRQDPDVILVGEIRDTDTAEIATNAALTGHLLLSTFHANDAATAIPRLIDMGIEPFLLSSSLELIIAQRLARRICDHCRVSYETNYEEVAKQNQAAADFLGKNKLMLYKGKGCNVCANTGYRGRIGVFELVQVTPEMKDLILHNPSTKEIYELAAKQGFRSFFHDGLEKVKEGLTTLDEILRITKSSILIESNDKNVKISKDSKTTTKT
jgi:type II secretory ATPase GspE/PulE/Tfp pilus assembly ATPase PilB-like protein